MSLQRFRIFRSKLRLLPISLFYFLKKKKIEHFIQRLWNVFKEKHGIHKEKEEKELLDLLAGYLTKF